MRDLTHYLGAVAFLAAAVSMFWHARSHRTHHRFWLAMACVFVLFAALKVVPLVPLASNAAREFSHSVGMHAQRRAIQNVAVGVIGLAAAIGVGAMLTYARPTRRQAIALTAAIITVAFAAVRWTSLHGVDALTGRLPWLVPLVEMGCALGAAAACWWRADTKQPQRHRRKPSADGPRGVR